MFFGILKLSDLFFEGVECQYTLYMDFNCVPFLQKHVYEYLPTNLLLIFNDKLLCKIVYLKAYFPRSYIIWTIYGI